MIPDAVFKPSFQLYVAFLARSFLTQETRFYEPQ